LGNPGAWAAPEGLVVAELSHVLVSRYQIGIEATWAAWLGQALLRPGWGTSRWQRTRWGDDSSDFHCCKWLLCSKLLLSSHCGSVLQWMGCGVNPADTKPALKITLEEEEVLPLRGWAERLPVWLSPIAEPRDQVLLQLHLS